MSSVATISEDEAVGRVAAICERIRTSPGTDFVPNPYEVMAVNPPFLEASRNKVRTIMSDSGKPDRLTKEAVTVAVSAMKGCECWIQAQPSALRKQGLDDEDIVELMAVVDLHSGFDTLLKRLQGEPGEKPWYG